MSIYQSVGLTIIYSDPLWFATRGAAEAVSDLVENYSHEIAADGGYKSASFTMRATQQFVEAWLERGLGRHIEVYNPGLVKIGEYFANQISVSVGGLSITRGPLMQVANRVSVAYTPLLNICGDPPPTGDETITTIANDTDSQAKYGILEEVVSGGQLIDDTTSNVDESGVVCGSGTLDNEAEGVRDTYLEEYKHPETSQELNLGGGEAPSVTVECLGYGEYLDRYVYENLNTGYTTISAKLQAVLTAEPNGLFSTDYAGIETNALTAKIEEIASRKAKAVIDELVSVGNATFQRTIFGIYNDRKAIYESIPTSVEYYHRLADQRQVIETAYGAIVQPWDVRPGKWLYFPDFLIGKPQAITDLRLDPRYMFVESVRYSAPYDLTLSGGKNSTYPRYMAWLGLK